LVAPAKRNTTLIRNQKERKLQPTLSPCDAAAILQSENNVENTNCPPLSTPYSTTPNTLPQNYKIAQKIQYPKSRMHAKLQSQKAAKQ